MNIYTMQFHANCPTNGVRVTYSLRIETGELIPVEELVVAVETIEAGERKYHEEIADELAAQFPGQHRLSAHHHGVGIETIRVGLRHEALTPEASTMAAAGTPATPERDDKTAPAPARNVEPNEQGDPA